MSVATQSSLIPVSSSALCSRLASRERSWIWVLRYRVRFRSARIGLGGTKLARNSPASASWHSHSASLTSVLRPGTCLTCRALTSRHSNSSSRIAHTGFQIHAGRLHHDLLRRRTPPASRAASTAPRPSSGTPPRAARASALARAPARTRSPAPYEHPAPPGARRPSPSDLPERDRHDRRPGASEN